MSDHLILIPVFNEAATLDRIVSGVRRHGKADGRGTDLVLVEGHRHAPGARGHAIGRDELLEKRLAHSISERLARRGSTTAPTTRQPMEQ